MQTVEDRHIDILNSFSSCSTTQESYAYIIELGKKQEKLESSEMIRENLVKGCQTQLYLVTQAENGRIYFRAYADALISSGLAQLLIWFYNGLTFEEVIKTPPSFLEELNIPSSLTPSRTNGLYSIHIKMKQEALKELMKNKF
ncbi:MAG: Cysteine desulfuration protein SufE [Chlamydiae bacterium]|nr:Cysteine desulfuration protein SufE [Chlamydiota bacterium]